jgi:hypothetical protein
LQLVTRYSNLAVVLMEDVLVGDTSFLS